MLAKRQTGKPALFCARTLSIVVVVRSQVKLPRAALGSAFIKTILRLNEAEEPTDTTKIRTLEAKLVEDDLLLGWADLNSLVCVLCGEEIHCRETSELVVGFQNEKRLYLRNCSKRKTWPLKRDVKRYFSMSWL
jgi:hypothetical protein